MHSTWKSPGKWNAPADLDQEIRELCEALNAIPGITTYQSCCGHGDAEIGIWFYFRDLSDLPALLWWFDVCHSGKAAEGWRVITYTDCGQGGPFFRLAGPPGAYDAARDIAKQIMDEITSAGA